MNNNFDDDNIGHLPHQHTEAFPAEDADQYTPRQADDIDRISPVSGGSFGLRSTSPAGGGGGGGDMHPSANPLEGGIAGGEHSVGVGPDFAPGRGVPGTAMSTTTSPHYAFHTNGFARFPIFMIVWSPIILLLQGFAYGLYWRSQYLGRKDTMDGVPTALLIYPGFLFLSLLVGVGLVAPLYFHCACGQMLRRQRDRYMIGTTVLYVFVCSAPLMILQQLMLADDWPTKIENNHPEQRTFAKVVAHLSLTTSLGSIWYLYIVHTADAMARGARDAADEFLKTHSPPRNPGVRMPPTMSMYLQRKQEEKVRHMAQMQRYGRPNGGMATPPPGVGPTPSRVPLMSPGGSRTPPPNPYGH